ncbi:DUF2934 domain-containing protein (plasmid) [Ensifer adhaerens]|uniref:DUF2934 domain-containing protein n=1 Tax=Ensifer adhaerens TaxID=106592 RepID=UPI003AF3E03C|nr:DUF2934 domain-containing protein [Ensifer adhaerens]UAY05425.1 DUF2934 domain-containing protein [Ensifer adhaerens]UAY12803.1 DUF2934 domain-containing protein [Ensifer adhaerens]
MSDTDELIRRRAYAIWESEGCPDGEDRRHWEQASREMAKRKRPPSSQEADSATGTVVAPSTAPRGAAGRPADEG